MLLTLTLATIIGALAPLTIYGGALLSEKSHSKGSTMGLFSAKNIGPSFYSGVVAGLIVIITSKNSLISLFVLAIAQIPVCFILAKHVKPGLLAQEEKWPVKIAYSIMSFPVIVTLGLITGVFFSYSELVSNNTNFFNDIPDKSESSIYLILFTVLLVLSSIAVLVLSNTTNRKLPTASKARRYISNGIVLPSFTGLLFAFIQNQTRNQVLANRYFIVTLLLVIFFVVLTMFWWVIPGSKDRLKLEKQHFIERKRVIKAKKRKKSRRNS